MATILILLAGMLIGGILAFLIFYLMLKVGKLMIIDNSQDGPYMFMELSREMPVIVRKRHVLLTVAHIKEPSA